MPIELIVERLGINIVPLPDLRRNYDVDGLTSCDLTCIYVDSRFAEDYENRYRFTLAHDLGHVVLHAEFFREYRESTSTLEEWYELHLAISEASGGSLEYQADHFAGFVLAPVESLREVFRRALPYTQDQIEKAVGRGVRPENTYEPAWDELCRRIARGFEVSGDVIQRRLKTDGFSFSDL